MIFLYHFKVHLCLVCVTFIIEKCLQIINQMYLYDVAAIKKKIKHAILLALKPSIYCKLYAQLNPIEICKNTYSSQIAFSNGAIQH